MPTNIFHESVYSNTSGKVSRWEKLFLGHINYYVHVPNFLLLMGVNVNIVTRLAGEELLNVRHCGSFLFNEFRQL